MYSAGKYFMVKSFYSSSSTHEMVEHNINYVKKSENWWLLMHTISWVHDFVVGNKNFF